MVVRAYRLTDAILIGKANHIQHFMLRDQSEYENYNVKEPEITNFRDEISAYKELPTDEELLGMKMETTEIKSALAEKVRVSIREIMTRVNMKYKTQSARYRRFGTAGLNVFDDQDLLACGRRVHRVAEMFFTELASTGLTVEILNELDNLNLALEAALDAQSDAISDRDIATEDRIEIGNALYDKLMNYCEIGKTIWITKDEAKYNDYVIYDTPNGEAGEIVPVE